jgi:peptidoglycan/xylan/chitin deacetylase (PgdA/CDA1 family)
VNRLDTILRWSPLHPAARWTHRGRVAVLGFHGVDDPERFATLMDHVRRTYRPISIDELETAIAEDAPLPERSVLVTFDDGERSVLEHGLPILRERGIPGVAFVIAGLLDTDTDFWWSTVQRLVDDGVTIPGHEGEPAGTVIRHLKQMPDSERRIALDQMIALAGTAPRRPQLTSSELATLRAGGIEIGNHTWSHPCLDQCEDGTVHREIGDAHDALTLHLGEAPRWFAYPNGNWSPCAEAELHKRGYALGFKFDHRHARTTDHPLRLSRLRANSDASLDRMALILSGVHPLMHHTRHDVGLAKGQR